MVQQVGGLLDHLQTEYTRLHPDFAERFSDLRSASTKASWKEVFRSTSEMNAAEVFMATAFSKCIHHVASAGKVAYLILLYANAWVNFDKSSVLDVAEVDFKVGGAFGRDG